MNRAYILGFLLISTLFVCTTSLRLQSHHGQFVHKLSQWSHQTKEGNLQENTVQEMSPAQNEFLQFLLTDQVFSEALQKESQISTEDSQRIKKYLIEHPDAAKQMLLNAIITQDKHKCCFMLNNDQKLKAIAIIFNQLDFTTAFQSGGSPFAEGYNDRLNEKINSSTQLPDEFKKCLLEE